MARRWRSALLAAALAIAGLPALACGKSDKDKYKGEYKPLNDRLLKLGEEIGRAPLEAGSNSNARLAAQFGRYASDLEDVNRDIAALHPPGELKGDSSALTSALDVVVKDLRRISSAAKRGDQKAAAAATRALTADANNVNEAQNALARATGANIGPR